MDGAFLALIVIVVVALAFDYTNGFHDAANAIAVAVSTKALTPRAALALAAVMNLVGAVISTKVAATVGGGIIDPPTGVGGLQVVFAALIGAIAWNLITWYFGLPSSSSHALIGGLVGAALAAAETVKWSGIVDKVVIPMVLSPLVGFVLGLSARVETAVAIAFAASWKPLVKSKKSATPMMATTAAVSKEVRTP